VLQFDALLLLYQGYLAMDLRHRAGQHSLPAIPADCRTEQVLSIDMIILSRPPTLRFPLYADCYHLNWFSELPSYEGRAAVEGDQIVFLFLATIIYVKEGAVYCT
jgi:hypothetical protein